MKQTIMSSSTPQSAYFIFPAHNEEANIRRLLVDYSRYFTNPKVIFHVVANNCSDKTVAITRQLAKKDSRILVSYYPEAIGKGGAIIEGFKAFIAHSHDNDRVGFVDADGSIKPGDSESLLQGLTKESQITISSRWAPGAIIEIKQSVFRRLLGRSFNLVIRSVYSLPYYDTQCGAKFLTKSALTKVLPHLQEKSFAFDVELLYEARKKRVTITEIPIHWHDTPNSSVKPFKLFVPLGKALWRIRFS